MYFPELDRSLARGHRQGRNRQDLLISTLPLAGCEWGLVAFLRSRRRRALSLLLGDLVNHRFRIMEKCFARPA